MKIKTITCHRAINHGAMLQAFALQKYLLSLGHDVEIIDYFPEYFEKYGLWHAPQKYKRLGLGWLYVFFKLPSKIIFRKKITVFYKFYNDYILSTKRAYRSISDLRISPPDSNIYIAGSDQIWNTSLRNGLDAAYYLDFGPKEVRRISYAASFATDCLMKGTENFVKDELSNFDAISVRESSALDLLNDLGYSGVQVVDPVFLLSSKEWVDIFHLVNKSKHEYILVYDFMNDPEIKLIAKRLSHILNCKIYSLFNESYADKNFFCSSPAMFVELVYNARCVVSNSFHGTAFSIIFHKDFFVLNRKDGLNIRMRDFLQKYSLSSRLITASVDDNILASSVDYSPEILKSICTDVLVSKKWLITMIEACSK